MHKILICFIFSCLLSGCSWGQRDILNTKQIKELPPQDYADQLVSLGDDYLKSDGLSLINLNTNSIEYLEKIYNRIVDNNELFFEKKPHPHFYIINDKTPFFFSLPDARFYFSTGLFKKYLKSEELFIAVLSLEIIKSNRRIYEKRSMIPLGFANTERMVKVTRIPTHLRDQLNQWSYLILKRAGYDASVTLNWIQVQNRNILDFAMLLGDSSSISKEEHVFKNFMAKEGVAAIERKTLEANSSRDFYQLINQLASKE